MDNYNIQLIGYKEQSGVRNTNHLAGRPYVFRETISNISTIESFFTLKMKVVLMTN